MERRFKVGDMVRCVDAASPLWQHHYYRVIAVGYSRDGKPRIGVSEMFPNTAAWDESRFAPAPPDVKQTSAEITNTTKKGAPNYSAITQGIVRGE